MWGMRGPVRRVPWCPVSPGGFWILAKQKPVKGHLWSCRPQVPRPGLDQLRQRYKKVRRPDFILGAGGAGVIPAI